MAFICNYARDRRRQKRGGGAEDMPFDETLEPWPFDVSDDRAEELEALDEALRRLEKINTRQSRIVECRFFGGLTIRDTALAFGQSLATVKREWTIARTWLYREMQEG